MFKLFSNTFAVSLVARVAAYVAFATLVALGYFNNVGALVLGLEASLTPAVVRSIFWAGAGVVFVCAVAIPFIAKLRQRDLWAEREELELSAIANLSVGKGVDEKYDQEPQLSRHRFLKDAVRNGLLQVTDMAGQKPNIHTVVSRESFRAFVSRYEIQDLHRLIAKWDRLNPPKKSMPPSPITVVDPLREMVLEPGWKLNFNPSLPRATKPIVFKSDGSFGEGGNRNEFRWDTKGGILEIWRENGLLQNKFIYDAEWERLVWVKDDAAKGIPFQYLYRIEAS